jgi:hypothetical protein
MTDRRIRQRDERHSGHELGHGLADAIVPDSKRLYDQSSMTLPS